MKFMLNVGLVDLDVLMLIYIGKILKKGLVLCINMDNQEINQKKLKKLRKNKGILDLNVECINM